MRKNLNVQGVALLVTSVVFSFATCAEAQEQVSAQQIDSAIATVKKIGLNGSGNIEAASAMQILNRCQAQHIPALLKGMQGTTPISANWIRSAVQTAARSGELPSAEVISYFNDRSESHLGRLQAFDLLSEADEKFSESTIPSLIDDPSLPLRLKAIDKLIADAEAIEDENDARRIGILEQAIANVRNVDQTQTIADMLEKAGKPIDLQKQLGLIPKWNLVGSFDNKDQKGFDVAYGPETNVSTVESDHGFRYRQLQ